MDILAVPLKDILSNRKIFGIFDSEFREAGWLDVTALLKSESSFLDLYRDGTVPADVLDKVRHRILELSEEELASL